MPTISHQPARHTPGAGLPSIEPVVPTYAPEPFDDPEWLFEPWYDGLRGFIYSAPGRCEIRLAGEVLFERCAELEERVARVLGCRDTILDGMVVALNRRGKPGFHELFRGLGYLAFAASDLLWLEGQDLRGLPLIERKTLLTELLPEDTGPLYKVLTLREHGRALFAAVSKLELAGIVAKRQSDSYGPAAVWQQVGNPGYQRGSGAAGQGGGSEQRGDRAAGPREEEPDGAFDLGGADSRRR